MCPLLLIPAGLNHIAEPGNARGRDQGAQGEQDNEWLRVLALVLVLEAARDAEPMMIEDDAPGSASTGSDDEMHCHPSAGGPSPLGIGSSSSWHRTPEDPLNCPPVSAGVLFCAGVGSPELWQEDSLEVAHQESRPPTSKVGLLVLA